MPEVTTFKPEVTVAWLSDSDDSFKKICGEVVKGTVGNDFFPNSQPRAKSVEVLFNVYAPTVVERDKQTSETSAARIAARKPLEVELRLLLSDIQAESGGDLGKLLTTNIPLARYPETAVLPTKPGTLYFYLYGNPQQLFVQCDAQPSNPLYTARISEDDINWKWVESDKRTAVGFSGLPVGVKLYTQMMVKNSIGVSEWSDSKPFMIPISGLSIPEKKRPKGYR